MMKNTALMQSLLIALATLPPGPAIEIRTTGASDEPLMPKLGYLPTANKHVAKRSKRKAAKQKARSCKTSEKQHKDRNKKGKP
jgi:hypothetical protein